MTTDDRAKLEALGFTPLNILGRLKTEDDLERYVAERIYLASAQAASAEPAAWRDHVEQRLLTWRQSFVNKSGDQLALDDFMDKRSLDDLIDFVCDEFTTPAPTVAPAAVTDGQINALIRAQTFWGVAAKETGLSFGPELHSFARDVLALATRAPAPAEVTEAMVEAACERNSRALLAGLTSHTAMRRALDAALATRTPEPHGRTVYQLPKGEQIAANAALSGQFKQASAPGYFVQQRSTVAHRTAMLSASPAPDAVLALATRAPVTDEMQSEFEPDEAGVQALRVAIEGECDGLDITDAQARAVLRYVGATIKCALTKTIRSRTRTPEPQAERTVEVHMDYEHGGLAFGPRPDSRGQAREGWKRAIDWLRNNYQDHLTIGDLCAAMLAASPTPDEQRAQAAQEDVEATVERLMGLHHEAADAYLFAATGTIEWVADNARKTKAADALESALRTALAGKGQDVSHAAHDVLALATRAPEDEQRAFDAFVSKQGIAANYLGDGQYQTPGVQLAYEAWLERAARSAHTPEPAAVTEALPGELLALACWLDAQVLHWQAVRGLPDDDEEVRALRKWARMIRAASPTPDEQRAQAAQEDVERFTLDEIADACCYADVSDSKYESICIRLQEDRRRAALAGRRP